MAHSGSKGGGQSLKILFITGSYPNKEHPADNVFVREHAKAAALYGEVRVLHWIRDDSITRGLWQIEEEKDIGISHGITTYRLRYRKPPLPWVSLATYLWCVGRAFRELERGGFRPDIIHGHVYVSGLAAAIIGRWYGIPAVVTEHWSIFSRKALAFSEIIKARFAFKMAHAVLPVSLPLQKAIQDYGISANFCVIPNAVDTSLFFPEIPSRGGRLKQIIFAGNLLPEKGISDILEVLGRLKGRTDWQMHFFGGGELGQSYEKDAQRAGIGRRVIFHGNQPKEEVARTMRRAGFMLHPSYGETFGASVIEALACGVPVVAYDVPALRQTVGREQGILVPLADKDALAEAVAWMLDHCNDYVPEKLSGYAGENFSLAAVGYQLHGLYCRIAKKR